MTRRYHIGWYDDATGAFEFRLSVSGAPVVLKNSKRIIQVGGRPRLIPSRPYVEWRDEAVPQLTQQWGGVFPKPIPINVSVAARFLFYMPTRRRVDLSNCYGGIEDCLQSSGVLEDDWQIKAHDGSRIWYDKEKPRIEITLTRFEECD